MKITKTIMLLAGIIVLASCGSKPPFPGYEKSESGLWYKFYKQGSSDKKPQIGDYIRVKVVRRVKDSVVLDSRKMNPKDGTVEYMMQKPLYPSSIESGLIKMSVGDSASFCLYTDSLAKYLKPEETQGMKKGTIEIFDVKLVGIRSKEEVEAERKKKFDEFMDNLKTQEPKLISDYIAANKITVKPDTNGVYFIEKEKGKGPKAKNGDKVSVIYTGKYTDGQVFDASDKHDGKPYEFTIGTQSVIPGWDYALMKMSKGGKATIILPSAMGYGEQGFPDPYGGGYAIKPYTPLVFDLELVDVK
jgi:FKBP-type peptidyl-prolyl cis-trans isomerase